MNPKARFEPKIIIHGAGNVAPIFVAGSMRTGSTKVQRMFTASGDFNWLPLWKTLNPSSYTGVPGEDPTARIRDAEAYVEEL